MGKSKVSKKNKEGNDIIYIDPNEFPEIITNKLSYLEDLEDKISNLQDETQKATEKADSLEGFKEKKFLGVKWKSGKTKKQIEETQDVIKTNTKVQKSQSEAIQMQFEYQKELTSICEYLFGIGCYNIATTEAMIANLNKQLSGDGPSYYFLSDNVKEQFINVVKRLKEHRDVLLKQEQLDKKIGKHQVLFDDLQSRQEKAEYKFQSLYDDLGARQEKTEDKFQSLFNELGARQKSTENKFQSLLDSLKDSLLDNIKLDEKQAENIKELFSLLKEKDKIDFKQSNQIDVLNNELQIMRNEIEKLSSKTKKWFASTLVLSVSSIILVIICYFILS